MDNHIVKLELTSFLIVYLLLLIILVIMKISKVNQTKLLLLASIRMTIQLVISGYILTYIFQNPNPLFTVIYIMAMIVFATYRVISKNKWLNKKFRIIVFVSLCFSGVSILSFFILAVVRQNLFNPQYAIPLGGMIIGNSMTGLNLGLKTFYERMTSSQNQIETMLNFGAKPERIILPFINSSLESALLPTLNNMIGMGIISLPGMMTGQILSGTLPKTAIMYQCAIMIAICTSLCITVFIALNIGSKTLINKHGQIDRVK